MFSTKALDPRCTRAAAAIRRRAARLAALTLALAGTTMAASTAAAQAAPTNLVSVCSGVSLPRSAVTATIAPVVSGIVTPVQGTVNPILGTLGAVLPLTPPLSIDVAGLLADAAAGAPIGLQTVNVNGVLVGPTDRCDARADSVNLTTPAGLAIGGNSITGLGAAGQQASAGTIDAVALGNRAATAADAGAAIAIGTGASVGLGATGSIALGSGAIASAPNTVALGAGSVAARGNEVSIGAPGAERVLTNVAAGSAATDGANLGQVQAAAGQVAAQVAALDGRAVQYDGAARDRVTLGGAGGTTLANVAPGALTATSTEAVNGSQLFATNQAVAGNTAAIAGLRTDVTGLRTDVTTLQGNVAGNTAAITNLQTSVAGNTGAITNLQTSVSGLQTNVAGNTNAITNLQTSVAGNTTAITNLQTGFADNSAAITTLRTDVNTGAVGPVRYSNAASPTVPNGGTRTNDVTLVGAAAGPVALHNVAAGRIGVGSTDAVNGGQVAALAANAVNAVTYDTDAAGNRTNSVTLSGGGGNATPVRLANVAAGTSSTDAVNLGQVSSAMSGALAQANGYTDQRIAAIGFDLRRVRRDAYAGTAGALAAAGLPQAYEAGRGMIALGGGTYMDATAVALGFSKAFDDGHTVVKLSGSYDSRGRAGASGGVGYQF